MVRKLVINYRLIQKKRSSTVLGPGNTKTSKLLQRYLIKVRE